MSAETTRLKAYNGRKYDPTDNPYGLDGVGGMDANFVQAFNDMGAVGEAVVASTDALAVALSVVASSWDAGTMAGNPGAGKLRASTAMLTSGSWTLYVSTTDSAGNDVSALLTAMGASTSATKARVRLVVVGNAAKYVDLSVTAVTVAAGYASVSVTYLAGPGGFTGGDPLALGWVSTGDLPCTSTTSTSSNAIGSGPKTFATTATMNIGVGSWVLAAVTGSPAANFMIGQITAISGNNITINATSALGSGTYADWTLTLTSKPGANGVGGPFWGGASGGAANAQTLAIPAIASISAGTSVEFIAGYSITGPATLNVSSTGALAMAKADGAAAGRGDVVQGSKYVASYDGTVWRLAGGGGANLAQIHAAIAAFS